METTRIRRLDKAADCLREAMEKLETADVWLAAEDVGIEWSDKDLARAYGEIERVLIAFDGPQD